MSQINPGDFITVTARLCSDKLQPYIKVGGAYRVAGLDRLKDGAAVLVLVRSAKTTCRINANRFKWRKIDDTERRDIVVKEGANTVFETRMKLYDEREQLIRFFYPHFVQAIAFRYAQIICEFCAVEKLHQFIKVTRSLKSLIAQHSDILKDHLKIVSIRDFNSMVDNFLQVNASHFTKMFFALQAEILKQNQELTHPTVRTYAFMVYCFCCEVSKFEDDGQNLMLEREGFADSLFLPLTNDLYLATSPLLEGYQVTNTDMISLCFRVFENNLKIANFKFK